MTTNRQFWQHLSVGSAIWLTMIATSAAAQSESASPYADSSVHAAENPSSTPTPADEGIGEIIVTAQKNARGESVQRVPLAITAINSEMMARNQLTNITDLGRIAPNVQLNESAFSGFPNFTIRGIGLNGTVRNIDPAVSVVVDGMPYEYLLGTVLDTFDLDGVEVLRGPQGILFGRNATGGVVSFKTKRPTDEFELEGTLRIGNGKRRDVSGVISGALVPDVLLARLAVSWRNSDGLFKDDNTGTFAVGPYNPGGIDTSVQTNQVFENSLIVRPTLVLKPSSNLTMTLLTEYVRERGGDGPAHLTNIVPNLQSLFGYTPDLDWNYLNHNQLGSHSLDSYRAILEIALETSVGILTSVSGYRKVDYASALDSDGTPFTLFHFPAGGYDKSRQLSQELRFASSFSDTVNFVVGGYYSDLDMNSLELREFHNIFGGRPANGDFLRYQRGRFSQNGSSAAAFLNVDVKPLEDLTLSFGARYTHDSKMFSIVPLSICGANFTGCPDTASLRKKSWNNFSPKLSVRYQFTPDVLGYASWAKGYRSGNFNSRAQSLAAIEAVNPENVTTIEAGLKSTLLNRRVRINIAAYSSQYEDIQRSIIISGVQTLGNAAGATIRGVELETTVMPFQGFELTGNLGYTDARFKEFLGLDVNGGGYDPNTDPILARQLKLERVPKFTAFLGASYRFHVPGFAPEISLRTSYTYRSSLFSDTLNEMREKPLGLLDANIGIDAGKFRVSLYGRNLTDAADSQIGTRLNFGPGADGVAFIKYYAPPRQYGLEFGLRF